jgi:hypothetical protein
VSAVRRTLAALLAVVAFAACGGGDSVIEGIVVGVDGDLTAVTSFQVRTTSGELLEFVPAPGIRFHDSAPLAHLTDHLVSGELIAVEYETLDDGTLVATRVEDREG